MGYLKIWGLWGQFGTLEIIQIREDFELPRFYCSKGATYNRGFAMNFRPRSSTSKVGVRPTIEGRPILGNLRYIPSAYVGLALGSHWAMGLRIGSAGLSFESIGFFRYQNIGISITKSLRLVSKPT